MAALDSERLGLVFENRPDIVDGIQKAADTPERVSLFNSIISFLSGQLDDSLHEPSAKRRRIASSDGIILENGSSSDHGMLLPPPPMLVANSGNQHGPIAGSDSLLIDMANAAAKEVVLLEIKDVSVSIPQRKKYDLCFTKKYLYTKKVGTTTPVQGMVYEWSQIEYVFYTPVPEKAQVQFNYVLFPRSTALASTKSFPHADFEPLVFTVPSSAPKPGAVAGYAAQTAAQVSDSFTSLVHWAINSQLQSVGNATAKIVGTDPRIFHSTVRQPNRPNERAVHVKAFRGSKDSYLFFLPNGILWGFKKPLLFIPLDRIVAVSYTNVLQRTFNMVVEVDMSHGGPRQEQPRSAQAGEYEDEEDQEAEETEGGKRTIKTEEIEFSMIDQEDYSSIDVTYVRRHQLHNRSMAEGRKARQQVRGNGVGPAGGGNMDTQNADTNYAAYPGAGEDEIAELNRAEQVLQDEQDDDEDDDDDEEEEEEDYDPGSEGESEGEGNSSEDDDDDDDDDEEAEGFDEDGDEELEAYAEDYSRAAE